MVYKSALAGRDLAEIAERYGGESLDLELRFLSAAESAFENLVEMPLQGAVRDYLDPRLRGLRMWRLHNFPSILVFYRPVEDGVQIVRVLHSSRDVERLFRRGA